MADVVDVKVRSRMMSGIRGKNTKPELRVRSLLHRQGFRFRVHVTSLPGCPDIVLKRFHAVIFVHGCFWHAHDCHLFKWPSTRKEFWKSKIEANKERDIKHIGQLHAMGWRVLTIWECALKGKKRLDESDLIDQVSKWLTGENTMHEITGR